MLLAELRWEFSHTKCLEDLTVNPKLCIGDNTKLQWDTTIYALGWLLPTTQKSSAVKDVEKLEPLGACRWECKMAQLLQKTEWRFLREW